METNTTSHCLPSCPLLQPWTNQTIVCAPLHGMHAVVKLLSIQKRPAKQPRGRLLAATPHIVSGYIVCVPTQATPLQNMVINIFAYLELHWVPVHGDKHHLPLLAILPQLAVGVGELRCEGTAGGAPAGQQDRGPQHEGRSMVCHACAAVRPQHSPQGPGHALYWTCCALGDTRCQLGAESPRTRHHLNA